MELKDYQQQALDTLDRYLEALKGARQQADKASVYLASDDVPDFLIEQAANLVAQAADYPRVAWESLRKASVLPSVTDTQGQELIPEHKLRVGIRKSLLQIGNCGQTQRHKLTVYATSGEAL